MDSYHFAEHELEVKHRSTVLVILATLDTQDLFTFFKPDTLNSMALYSKRHRP
jgi:hypothetical protein